MTMAEDIVEKNTINTGSHSRLDHTKTDSMTENANKPSKEESKTISELADRLKILEAGAAEWLRNRQDDGEDEDIIPEPIITRVPTEQWRSVKSKWDQFEAGSGALIVSTAPGTDKSVVMPNRLAINSEVLLAVFQKWSVPEISKSCNVLVWPFKHLIINEQKIKEALNEAEEDYQKECNHEDSQLSESSESPVQTPKAKPKSKRIRDELRCLVEFMDSDMHSIFDRRNKIQDATLKEIGFDYLWLLFKPGDLVFETDWDNGSNPLQAYRVLNVTGGRFKFHQNIYSMPPPEPYDAFSMNDDHIDFSGHSHSKMTPFIIDCISIDFDGQNFGPRGKKVSILPYSGEKSILSLGVYPANFHPDYDNKRVELLTRGKKFMKMTKGAHKRYTGICQREPIPTTRNVIRPVSLIVQEVDSDVIIDQEFGIKHFGQILGTLWRVLGGAVISRPTPHDSREIEDFLYTDHGNFDHDYRHPPAPPTPYDVANDFSIDTKRRSTFVNATDLLDFHHADREHFSDDFLILLSPRLYGYVLLNRKWLPLRVDLLTDVVHSSTSTSLSETRFEDLVLPHGHKQLLEALVKYQLRLKSTNGTYDHTVISMDVVKGKGHGLIILLHGPPGVGKTSTAECVAAHLKRPLFPITCGDLGDNASTVEKQLDEFCYLAGKWRCVLLLDEADVFLSKREKGDFIRNSLVSIFLRTIEYFSGVLILTTNRVGEIDEAFRSRIHICLFYPRLDQLSTAKIWEKNLSRIKTSLPGIDIEEEEIRQFYEILWTENEKHPTRHWNGRQIKNAFQTALALADREFQESGSRGRRLERPILRGQHFKKVAQTSAHFDDYFATLHGLETEDAYGILAAREEIRKDHIPPISYINSKERKPFVLSRKPTIPDGDNLMSEDEDSDDVEIQKLKLKLERKLNRKYAKGKSTSRFLNVLRLESENEEG